MTVRAFLQGGGDEHLKHSIECKAIAQECCCYYSKIQMRFQWTIYKIVISGFYPTVNVAFQTHLSLRPLRNP